MKPSGNCLCASSIDCVIYLKSSLRTTRRVHAALARICLCCVTTATRVLLEVVLWSWDEIRMQCCVLKKGVKKKGKQRKKERRIERNVQ